MKHNYILIIQSSTILPTLLIFYFLCNNSLLIKSDNFLHFFSVLNSRKSTFEKQTCKMLWKHLQYNRKATKRTTGALTDITVKFTSTDSIFEQSKIKDNTMLFVFVKSDLNVQQDIILIDGYAIHCFLAECTCSYYF